MVATKITVDDAQLRGAIARLLDATGNLRPAFQDIGEIALNTVQSYFDREEGPDGKAWQDLAPATLRRKRKKRQRLKKLQQRGVLVRSIAYKTSSTDMQIGSNLVYARIHQLGGEIQRQASSRTLNFRVNRSGRSRFSRARSANFQQDVSVGPYTINIPARPYLNLGDDPRFVEQALSTLQNHIEGAWNG